MAEPASISLGRTGFPAEVGFGHHAEMALCSYEEMGSRIWFEENKAFPHQLFRGFG